MALPAKVEQWAIKKAQIDQKKLLIEDIIKQRDLDIAPLNDQINTLRSQADAAIATRNAEIAQLENEIRQLA